MSNVDDAYELLAAGEPLRAIALLRTSGMAGDAACYRELAVWFLDGRYVPRDLAQSRENFRHAGDLGDLTAEHVFICFLANGTGGRADWQGAKARLSKLAAVDERAARQLEVFGVMRLTADGDPLTKPTSELISNQPEAWRFPDFASSAECDYLIGVAIPLLQQSVVVDPTTGQIGPHPIRTSEGAMFPYVSEDLVVSALNRRIASASGTGLRCGEPLQILRYRPGQQYRPHSDALPATDNQRVLTALVYLNAGYEGGETFFTRTRLKFGGKTGDALLFRNAAAGGRPDPDAEHAGLPVLRGEKYIASRWIREFPMTTP